MNQPGLQAADWPRMAEACGAALGLDPPLRVSCPEADLAELSAGSFSTY